MGCPVTQQRNKLIPCIEVQICTWMNLKCKENIYICVYILGGNDITEYHRYPQPIWIVHKTIQWTISNLITKNLMKPVPSDWAFSDTCTIYERTLWGIFSGYLFFILYDTRVFFSGNYFPLKQIFFYFFVPRKFRIHQECVVLRNFEISEIQWDIE